jgi:hypothetical protein
MDLLSISEEISMLRSLLGKIELYFAFICHFFSNNRPKLTVQLGLENNNSWLNANLYNFEMKSKIIHRSLNFEIVHATLFK